METFWCASRGPPPDSMSWLGSRVGSPNTCSSLIQKEWWVGVGWWKDMHTVCLTLSIQFFFVFFQVRTKDHRFESVSHLISYHMDNRLPIISAGSEVCLKQPVERRAWNYRNHNIPTTTHTPTHTLSLLQKQQRHTSVFFHAQGNTTCYMHTWIHTRSPQHWKPEIRPVSLQNHLLAAVATRSSPKAKLWPPHPLHKHPQSGTSLHHGEKLLQFLYSLLWTGAEPFEIFRMGREKLIF